MLFITDIFGEIHTKEDRDRIEKMILSNNHRAGYDFILTEEIGHHIALTEKDKQIGIRNHLWGISPRSYELGIKLNIPVIGIDTWEDYIYRKPLAEQFVLRETRMVEVIREYSLKGSCAVIVGDTHLRTIRTNELGDVSLLHKAFYKRDGFNIIRSPNCEIK